MNYSLTGLLPRTICFMIVGLTLSRSFAGTPVGYYNSANTGSAATLRSSLNDIVTAGFQQVGYDNTNPALYVTDQDPANANNVIMIYGNDSRPKTDSSGANNSTPLGGWNREHTFPQSFFNSNEPMRSDIHALFPSDADINTQRSNHPYGIVSSPSYTDIFGNKDVDGATPTFEPANVDKGRVARAILYMDIRYEGEGSNPNLTVVNTYPAGTGAGQMAFLNTLLDWHRLYPPTAFDRARNAKVWNRQKNANPFVDHPEWVSLIYGGTAWTMTSADTLTVASLNRAPANTTAGTADIPMLQLDLGLTANQFHVGQIGVSNTGTATDAEVTAIKLWWDVDRNGVATSVDTLLDTRTFSAGAATFSLTPSFYVAPGTTSLLITASVAASTGNGQTVRLRANSNGIIHDVSGGVDTNPAFANQESQLMTVGSSITNGDSISITGTTRAALSGVAGTADVPVLSVHATMAGGNEWDLGSVAIAELGTSVDADITALNLYHDADNDGVVDSGETQLATTVLSSGSGTFVLGSPYRITPGTRNLLITANISASAVQDNTLQLRLVANGISHSSTGGTDINPTFAAIDSGVLTISAPTGGSAGLIISEVYEGNGGTLKYVELHNRSASPINLASPQIRLRRYANGAITFTSILLTGTVAADDYFVIVNNSADFDAIFPSTQRDQINANISHNGNDVYDLHTGGAPGTVLDSFAADLAGTSIIFAADVVAYRISEQLPNSGAWGGSVQPAANQNSPSEYWATRAITAGNANGATVGTPGASSEGATSTVTDWNLY